MTLTQQQREAMVRVLAAAIDPEANRVLEAMAGKIERHKLSYPEQMLMGIAVGARWADAKTKAEAALAAVLPVIRAAVLEEAARWHEAQLRDEFGPDYGMATPSERAAIRFSNRIHVSSAAAVRALIEGGGHGF